MRKIALLSAAAAIALGAGSAKADVFVSGNVYKDVDITIHEKIETTKIIDIATFIFVDPKGAADSNTTFNQNVYGNWSCSDCTLKIDKIDGSVNDNVGITSVNQAAGNLNNQGTAISFAFVDGSGKYGYGLASSQVAGNQYNGYNTVGRPHNYDPASTITGSVNRNEGITAVNQSSGTGNNQANGISIAASRLYGVALSDTALGQVNSKNQVNEFGAKRFSTISGSVNQNTGITSVNQSSGNLGNQSNVVSLSASGF